MEVVKKDLKGVRRDFTMLHHSVSDSLKLTPISRLVYLCIKYQVNINSPYTFKELKSKFKLSQDVVKKALKDCEALGLWKVTKVKSFHGGVYLERNVITLTGLGQKRFEKIPNGLLLTDKFNKKQKAFLICIFKHIRENNIISYTNDELIEIMKVSGFGVAAIEARISELLEMKVFNKLDGGSVEIDLCSFIDIDSDVIENIDQELQGWKNKYLTLKAKYEKEV